ncbi:MAG: hypothetical protein AAF467_04265 [Actinomycetota bacterium]
MRAARLMALVCAVALAVATACAGDSDDLTADDADAPAGAEATEAADGVEPEPDDAPEGDQSDDGGSGPSAAERELVGGARELPAGAYVFDALGTEVFLDTATELEVPFLAPATIIIGDGSPSASGTSQIVGLLRPTGLASPDELELDVHAPTDGSDDLTRFGGDLDITAWAGGSDEIEIEPGGTWTIGGKAVPYVDVKLSSDGEATVPGGCGPGPEDRCLQFSSSGVAQLPSIIVRTSESYRIGLVDQGEDEPIVVFAVADDGNESWFDTDLPSILDTISFGERGPLPADAPAPEAGFDETTGATELVESFQPIAENRYFSDSLGTRITFDVEGEWEVQPNGDGYLVLTGSQSRGPNDRDVVFMRVSDLSDPETGSLDDPWGPSQFAEWLAAPPAGLAVTNVTEGDVAGRPATLFDVTVDEDAPCVEDDYVCLYFAGTGPNAHFFSTGYVNRVIWVDQADEDPLAIVVGRPVDDTSFDADADRLLATLELGPTAPNPTTG